MESSRKRKAPPATPSAPEAGGATKKLRLLNSNHAATSQKNVETVGQRLVDQLRRATDKTGRLIATEFLTLPDRDDFPDYYDVIKLPVSVETIEEKVKNNGYPDISAVESDFKRLIQNAKEYNAPRSPVYEDAERIRKLVSNFMRSNNPQYEIDPSYQAAPTPIPTEAVNATPASTREKGNTSRAHESRNGQRSSSRRASAGTPIRRPSLPRAPSTATPQADDADELPPDANGTAGETDFTGMTFQDAQEALLEELIAYSDEEGLQIYTPFVNLPSRKLEDYYKLIKHPVSLQSLLKRARGIKGRDPPTGISDFKTWEQLEEEVSFVWRNAQEYNEDESEMFQLADDFKAHFEERIAEAKSKVKTDLLPTPKIKLGGPKPKVTLNLSSHRTSMSPGAAAEPDTKTQPQQSGQTAATTSHPPAQNAATTNGLSQSISVPKLERPPTSQVNGSPVPAVKSEGLAANSPGPGLPATNGVTPAPTTRLHSASPFPMPFSNISLPTPVQLPPIPKRPYPLAKTLLPSVTIATHPGLNLPKPGFSAGIPPHPILTHQSATFTLPATHYLLQIAPTISHELSMGRPYKMFVTLNGTRLNQRDTVFHRDTGRRSHVYEGSLAPGVNRVEVEIAAAKQELNGETSGKGLDVEKVTIYANLMR